MDEVKLYLNAMGAVCALGDHKDALAQVLFADKQTREELSVFLTYDSILLQEGQGCYVGRAPATLPSMPQGFERYTSRNNALLLQAFAGIEADARRAIERYGADRVAVILGTSTSGIAEGEAALAHRKEIGAFPQDYNFAVQEMSNGAEFLASWLGLSNMATTISTACSSSAKVFSHAAELIRAGICDAAIVGGADSLCKLTLNGFHSLGALSAERCNPFSQNRSGISIGEGAALFVMSAAPSAIRLMSVGESSDSFSMTAPEPEGVGAEKAMRDALDKAGLESADISYVNLHGTATHHNDVMEGKAVMRVFGADMPCSSTKALTGHTLGAAGAVEAALCWLMLSPAYNPAQKLLPHLWDGVQDEEIALRGFASLGDVLPHRQGKPLFALSNSFAFGGSNAAIVLKQEVAYDE